MQLNIADDDVKLLKLWPIRIHIIMKYHEGDFMGMQECNNYNLEMKTWLARKRSDHLPSRHSSKTLINDQKSKPTSFQVHNLNPTKNLWSEPTGSPQGGAQDPGGLGKNSIRENSVLL